MSWGGKHQTRMGVKERAWFLRNSHRSLPKPENPHGVPSGDADAGGGTAAFRSD